MEQSWRLVWEPAGRQKINVEIYSSTKKLTTESQMDVCFVSVQIRAKKIKLSWGEAEAAGETEPTRKQIEIIKIKAQNQVGWKLQSCRL